MKLYNALRNYSASSSGWLSGLPLALGDLCDISEIILIYVSEQSAGEN